MAIRYYNRFPLWSLARMSETKEFPSDKADKFVIRFPDGMRDRIKADADKNDRSMTAEIIERLKAPDPSDALQTILRMERQKLTAEMEEGLARQRLAYLATIYRVLDKHLRPFIQSLPHSDLLDVLDRGKAVADEAMHPSNKDFLQALNGKIKRAEEIEKELRQVSATTITESVAPILPAQEFTFTPPAPAKKAASPTKAGPSVKPVSFDRPTTKK